ncbi:hypothetical protein C2G38_2218079 [Gigaspora rosea]|uniref:Uncharacterized protein n=1 Tax=Gigaspora rosea TaxID=44941 RepID=A0A397U732_9GLOM|nr:hypothetical protein C2G38_2218079 [Gigaspora rosea]
MTKRKNYKTTLISIGKIVPEIHYGAFSREWWITIEKDSNNQATMLFPIRIGMKTLVELNGHEFFIKVLEPNIEDSPSSRYQASCGLVYSEIYTSSSAAITSLYQQLFVVFGIGISKNQDWNYAGTSYQSSFVNNIGKRRLLYVQSFIASKCNITIYEENKFKTIINGTTPTDSWLKIDQEWNNEILLEQIFRYHLKKRTKSNINWIEFIHNWKNQESKIIELRTSLAQLYEPKYQINSRELCAWKSMLRHIGCTEITPYNKDQSEITSSNTIYEARRYARLHGPDKLDQLQEFLNDKNNVVMSSYKTDTKTGLPVKYLKDTKEALWENFSYQLPNSMKRTTFMKLLQGKQYIYQENLGGLCSTCSRYGYEVFAEISQFVKTNIQDSNIQKNYINEFEYLQRYFKKIYEQKFEISIYGVPIHNACISHCLLYAFGVCKEIHNYECNEYSQLFKVFYQLKEDTPITLHNEIDEYRELLLYYFDHQTRKAYLNTQVNASLLELDEKGALIIVDYKMKILPKSARETKEKFFGKKEWTLHSILVYTRKIGSLELDIQAHDHWSNDPCQDAWFTASSLHAIFLEPGEAKTTIDSHHAQIAHAINRHIKLGFDILSEKDIENAISKICGTSVAHLEPNRKKDIDKEKKAKNKLPGISNWFEWSWPITEEYAGCIRARDIANIEKLQLKTIEKPNPDISTPSIPKNPWTISLPNDTGFVNLVLIHKQLETRGILKDININRKELVKKLELVLAEETLEKTLECSSLSNQVQNLSENERLNKNSNVSSSSQVINAQNKPRGKKKILKEYKFTIFLWPLASRWALKSSQKYGKKGCGKRISKKLKQCVENGVIEKDEVPKLETIQN